MKKLFLTLICLLLLGYVGFKGATWYQARSILKQAQDQLEGEGVLRWGRIGSSVTGHVSVYDLEYQHFSLTQPIRATRMTFDADGAPELLDALSGGSLPGHWQLTFENLRMALSTPLIRDWVAPRNEALDAGLVNIPCGGAPLDLAGLMKLGVEQVAADVRLEQDAMLDDDGGLSLDVQAGKLGSIALRLPGFRFEWDMLKEPFLDTYAGPVKAEIRDGGLMRRLAAYCAREADEGTEAWAEHATGRFSQKLTAAGFQPSDQLRALYKVWLRDGGELKATLSAADPLLGLPERNRPDGGVPVDPDVGNFEVFYNGARVPDLFVRYLPRPEAQVAAVVPEDRGTRSDSPDAPAYRPADSKHAERWMGRQVRATLTSGRVVEGKLSGTSGDRLEVTRIVDGGEVAYPLARSAITLFEVWRRTGDVGIEPEPRKPDNDATTSD